MSDNDIISGELERVEKRIEDVAQMLEKAAATLRAADTERLERLRDLSRKFLIIAHNLQPLGVNVLEMGHDEAIEVAQWKVMRVRELARALATELTSQPGASQAEEVKSD